MRSRAYRRHCRDKALTKTRQFVKESLLPDYFYRNQDKKEVVEKIVMRTHKNRKVCSCDMCGNPRKYLKQITFQEARADDSFKDALECLEISD